MGAHRSSSSECGSPRARLLFAVITPLTRTLIQKSPNFRTSQNIAKTRSTSLGWNNQRRGQKRVVRLLPREIVRYTRGVEKFFPAKRRRRKFIVHRGRIKHAVPAVSSAGSTDPISSIRSLDPTERRIREFLEFLAAALRAGEGGESLSRWEGGKQSSDETVYLDGCATHGGAPVPDVNLAVSLIDAAPETLLREEKFPKESGEGANERDLSLSTLQFSIFTPPDIYIYILFLYLRAISVYRRRIR